MSVQPRLVFDSSAERKARGAFFTPAELADFLAGWAIRAPQDSVLEPSCGEAALLAAAGRHLRTLGGQGKLSGLDVHPPSIEAAREVLTEQKLKSDLRVADFFDEQPSRHFDVVIGNPPYVRYQAFSGNERSKAQQAALAGGVRLSGLANAWAAFVVHASRFLKEDGRLALVLPASLLSVNYAGPVRRFLLERFASVKLILFEERVFPGVLEEVILLLAEGTGGTSRFDLFQVRDLAGLTAIGGLAPKHGHPWTPAGDGGRWTPALLRPDAAQAYSRLAESSDFTELAQWGDTDLGMVTGNNDFFTMTESEAAQRKLRLGSDLIRISPPGSRHLRGLTFTSAAFDEMARAGGRVYLFYPGGDTPSGAARRHISLGESRGVHQAYKCAVRTPWWRVPTVRIPDLFLTYMNQDAPRLVRNQAKAAYLNSIHGVTLMRSHRVLGAELLPLAMLNSVTLLGAELCGRSYGGGILKVEPKEADRLPMPSPATLKAAAADLKALRPQLSKCFGRSRLDDVVRRVDEILLVGQLGVGQSLLDALRSARQMMAARRAARAGTPR